MNRKETSISLSLQTTDEIDRTLHLAESTARRRRFKNEDLDDVRSDALWGLLAAYRTYNPGPASFQTYATRRMDWAIRRGRQIRSGIPRRQWENNERAPAQSLQTPSHANTDETLQDQLPAPDDESLFELALGQARAALPDREQQVISMLFDEDITQVQAAKRLGVTQMTICRDRRSALNRLRNHLGYE